MANEKDYTNGEITVIWKPDICIRSGNRVKGLPEIFKPGYRPWIKIGKAATDEIKQTIDTCPLGALSYKQ